LNSGVPVRNLGAKLDAICGKIKSDDDRREAMSLARTRSTVAACHLPPAGVATLRRFNSSAAFRADRPASSANSGRSSHRRMVTEAGRAAGARTATALAAGSRRRIRA
jgi:hypothetical protein